MFIAGWNDKEGNSITWEPLGMFPSPCGEEWSTRPYTKEQKIILKKWRAMEKARDKVIEHLKRTDRSIMKELELIKSGKSTLPRYAKNLLIELEKTV